MPNTWLQKEEKITYGAGGHKTEIDFVLVGKEDRKYVKEVKMIP